MIVPIWIVLDVVGKELGIIVRCDASDLVTSEWNTPVAWAVDVGVAAGARPQMQTPVTLLADALPIVHLGMHAALFTQISWPDQPDATEIGVEQADDGRSEERRVGKEGRSRWSPDHYPTK